MLVEDKPYTPVGKTDPIAGSCEHNNKCSASKNAMNFMIR